MHVPPLLLLLLQVNQTLPFRGDGYKADTKDLMSPNACVAGQLGATAEPSSCKVELKASGEIVGMRTPCCGSHAMCSTIKTLGSLKRALCLNLGVGRTQLTAC
jgi:hypothetical protein